MRLNVKTIAGLTLPAGKSEQVYWDDNLRGFGLRLRRRGGRLHRTWISQYRVAGRTGKTTHGDAELVSESKARAAVRQVLANGALGADPQAERAAKRAAAALTFRAVAASYLDAYERTRRPSSYHVTKLYLTGAYFKPLHAMAVSEVTHADIAAAIRRIENNHSAITAGAARRAVSGFFAWTIAEGLMGRSPINPMAGTRRPTDPAPRDRVLSIEELVAVWKAVEDDPQESEAWRDYCRIIRLLILLLCRASEIGGMAQVEFDFGPGAVVWTLPRERSKNKREHPLVLPEAALDIVRASVRHGRERLFGAHSDGFTQWSEMKQKLDRRLGDKVKGWRVHDLRRSAATHMAEIGVMPHVIEECLNHVTGRSVVSRTYNRSRYSREVTSALARWSEYMLAVVEGRASKLIPIAFLALRQKAVCWRPRWRRGDHFALGRYRNPNAAAVLSEAPMFNREA
jgi:integrase